MIIKKLGLFALIMGLSISSQTNCSAESKEGAEPLDTCKQTLATMAKGMSFGLLKFAQGNVATGQSKMRAEAERGKVLISDLGYTEKFGKGVEAPPKDPAEFCALVIQTMVDAAGDYLSMINRLISAMIEMDSSGKGSMEKDIKYILNNFEQINNLEVSPENMSKSALVIRAVRKAYNNIVAMMKESKYSKFDEY